jgi:hypothetical protein
MLQSFYAKTTIADRIIICLSLLFLLWLYKLYWTSSNDSSDYALIYVLNQAPIQVNLHHSPQQITTVKGRLGESQIEVKEGSIRFITSPCHSKFCIHAGWLTKNGDFVACLPNQVSIELHNLKDRKFDSVVY